MKPVLFRHIWGFDPDPLSAMAKAAAAGYDGLEFTIRDAQDQAAFAAARSEHGLRLVVQMHTCGGDRWRSVDEHLASFSAHVQLAAPLEPELLNCHGGSDEWTLAEAVHFHREAIAIAGEAGFTVAFETHRLRPLYNPFATLALLDAVPELRLTADISHWTCVCSRLFDLSEAHDAALIDAVASRTDHVHARVGTDQSPQIADPRIASSAATVAAFMGYWQRIVDAASAAGQREVRFTPEFGPPPYQPVDPVTGAVRADLSEICDWMAGRIREGFTAP